MITFSTIILTLQLRLTEMKLRDHPLMSRAGVHNWPPAWLWRVGSDDAKPYGEVGILREVVLSEIDPPDRCFMTCSIWGLNTSVVFCLKILLSAARFTRFYASTAGILFIRLTISN